MSDENEDEEKDSPAPILKTPATPEDIDKNLLLVRSKTMPTSMIVGTGNKRMKESKNQVSSTIITDRLKTAKEEAERAIKVSINCVFFLLNYFFCVYTLNWF